MVECVMGATVLWSGAWWSVCVVVYSGIIEQAAER